MINFELSLNSYRKTRQMDSDIFTARKSKGRATFTRRYIGCSLNKMSSRAQTLYYHVGTDVGDKPDPPSTLDKYSKETTFVANMPLVLMVITEVCPIGSEIMTVGFCVND